MRSRLTISILVALLALFTFTTVAQCKVIYVNKSGDDFNTGLTWALAKRTIQAGINAAISGDEVWVAKETYIECITLKSGVGVYGGFMGSETARSERNWTTNITVINADLRGSAVTSPSGTSNATIDGFTIQRGTPGISCSSSPIISNNTITRNTASGIYCSSSSAPIISNNIITENLSVRGGGIRCSSSSPTISNNTITMNAAYEGGGIYCESSSSPNITNNTITGNAATYGGAIHCLSSSPNISNNIAAFNSSGIYISSGTPVLRNNCVYNPDGDNYSGISAGTGDISVDPKFACYSSGNIHIQPNSPCRNAGWNSALGITSVDMDNQPRIQYLAHIIDIGADESDGTQWNIVQIIVRVDGENGNDSNDGSSWALAMRTVRAAIDKAAVNGGEVWVKAGTYNEQLVMKQYVRLYGGFAGTETTKDGRDYTANKSILDGDKKDSVVNILVAGYRMITIDGFTIRNGVPRYTNGGGIYCTSSSPIISNNIITENFAGYGGGIYLGSFSYATIINNTITSNNANSGSGIYCDNSSSNISNNIVTKNKATSRGGGICCCYFSPNVSNNTITENEAVNGGAIYCLSSSPNISNNILAFNSSGIASYNHSTSVLRDNCVYNPSGSNYYGLSAGTGDISTDPLFMSPQSNDYHLKPNSPCIGTGYNAAVQTGLMTDIEGKSRILPVSGVVDMGCYEYDFTLFKITHAKATPEQLIIQLQNKPITAAFGDAFYIEESDRICGMKVISSQAVTPGDLATITGHLTTDNGERAFQADSVVTTPGNASNIPGAIFIPNKSIGGSGYFWNYNNENCGQQGITNALGLNNTGLLVKISGKYTQINTREFTINDGSGVSIKCVAPSTVTLNPSWGYVSVTGISSCEKVGTELRRLIRVRDSQDIVSY